MEQKINISMPINKVIGGMSGEFFHFYCEKCGKRIKVKFIGHQMAIPQFETECSCGEHYVLRATIAEIPPKIQKTP